MFSLKLDLAALSAGRKKGVVNRAVKSALTAAAKEWHQKYYAGHFTKAGAQKYGYYKRKGELISPGSKAFRRSYTGKKLRKFGHTDPLKFTGETYHLGKVAKIKATSKQARVILPAGLNRKHPKSQIRMRDEATRVLPDESSHLKQIAEAEAQRYLKTNR
jgi:hypothetical protein